MANFKEKFSKWCDEAETKMAKAKEKRIEAKKKRKEWWEKHPNLERAVSTIIIGGTMVTFYGGVIALSIWSDKDRREHPEKYLPKEKEEEDRNQYDEIFEKLNALEIAPGEQVRVVVGENGIKNVTYTYEPVEEPEETEEDPDDVVIGRF